MKANETPFAHIKLRKDELMRKVKVAAAFLCLASAGMLGGIAIEGNEVSVAHMDQRNQILEMTEEPVTTAASIETTAIVTTATTALTTASQTAVTTTELTATTSATTAATTTAQTVAQTEPVTEPAPETVTEAVYTQDVSFLAPAPVTEPPVLTDAPAPATTEAVTETVQSVDAPAETQDNGSYAITVTDREYIMLCNVVGHEYGADWISVEEKALVAEVIMNRVNSPAFPNTIYEVLTQRNQFAGLEYLIEMDEMSHYVTPSVMEAVDLYLSHPEQFQHGYLFFNGDGSRNYFRTSF